MKISLIQNNFIIIIIENLIKKILNGIILIRIRIFNFFSILIKNNKTDCK